MSAKSAVVTEGKVVQYRYTFHDSDKYPHLAVEDEPVAYLHGAGEVLPGVEEAMAGKAPGAAFTVTVPAEKAFGVRMSDEDADRAVPLDEIDGDIQVGDPIDAEDDDGDVIELWVKSISKDEAVLTLNHPLAGMDITLDLQVLAIRDANADEQEAGVAFGWSGDEPPEEELDWDEEGEDEDVMDDEDDA